MSEDHIVWVWAHIQSWDSEMHCLTSPCVCSWSVISDVRGPYCLGVSTHQVRESEPGALTSPGACPWNFISDYRFRNPDLAASNIFLSSPSSSITLPRPHIPSSPCSHQLLLRIKVEQSTSSHCPQRYDHRDTRVHWFDTCLAINYLFQLLPVAKTMT